MRQALIGGGLAALLGAAVVVAVFGLKPLNPQEQGWLLAGPLGPDPIQLWLGWHYFRAAPWMLPPGANPDYGMELGTAIYFADAIPLLALLGKALRGVVDLPQYVGPWLLACGLLQGFFGWRLMGRATRAPLARVCGAGLLALQPMLVNRMAGHTPLAGQWTILAALLLATRPTPARGQGVAWVGLLAVTALIHSYLLAMVGPLWGADWLRRVWLGKGDSQTDDRRDHQGRRWPAALTEALVAPAAVLGALWLGGFFLLRGGFDTGPGSANGTYGTWNFDLLAWFDGGKWSALLPDLPDPGHWEAGDSYLGLGGLLLLLAGLVAWLRRPQALPRRFWPLTAALLALLAFAISWHVSLGGHYVTLFQPPPLLLAVGGALRNSERMAWPLAYTMMLAAVALLARHWGGRRTGWLLLGLLVLQAVDLRPGLALRHSFVITKDRGVPQRLFDPFWAEAAARYARIRAVPESNMGEGWENIARFAAQHGLPTDSVYMARVNETAAAALRARMAEVLRTGHYEPGTLYILRDAESLALARASHDPARDAMIEADGYHVLAPGWRQRDAAAMR